MSLIDCDQPMPWHPDLRDLKAEPQPNIHDVPYYVWTPNLSAGARGVYPNRPKKDYRRDWRLR